MSDLDLTAFLKDASSGVVKLDWLDVDEEEYRKLDTLPKQNLDISPDLQALWNHNDEAASKFIPNTGAPKTMGDLSMVHGKLATADDVACTARLTIMQSTDPRKIQHVLASRYDTDTLRASRTALSTVLAERGLLGRYYVAASDFSGCDQKNSKAASEFVRRFASEAKFVIAKTACGDCAHHKQMPGGAHHCGVFHKELRTEVPYTDVLAAQVEKDQSARGRTIQASVGGTPRERIKKAFLGSGSTQSGFTGRPQVAPAASQTSTGEVLIAAENLTKKRTIEAQKKIAAAKARPIVAFLRREMLKGRAEGDLVQSLRMAFDLRDLEETKAEWAPLFREAGLYGAVYTTQDSFDDCREGADFINKHASKVRAIVAGEKCGSCIFNQVSRCMMYGRKLIASPEDVLTTETVNTVLDEFRIAGKLPQDALQRHWGDTPVTALRAIHKAASETSPVGNTIRSAIETAFHGGGVRASVTSDLTKRQILKTASKYMNEGLYGQDLLQVLRGQFDPRDLVASAADLRAVLAEQGLQGIKYVDPTIYDDYGNGCKEASRIHRTRTAVKYLKVGSKCGSCVHQTTPGFCSVISKQLVVEPPYVDKKAEQAAILNSGSSTEVSYQSLMNNGLSMMAEYQLQHREGAFSIDAAPVSIDTTIEFGAQKVKL